MSRRALLQLLLRLAVAAGLLWWVFQKALPETEGDAWQLLLQAWKPEQAFELGRPSPWWTLAGAVLVIGLGFALNALRFQGLLQATVGPARWSKLWRAYLVAGFFNLILPGAILGDAYRVVDAKGLTGSGSRALGLVLVERLLGLSALGSIGLVCAPFLPLAPLSEHGLGWLPMLLGASFLLGTLALLHPRSNALFVRLGARLAPWAPRLSAAACNSLTQVGRMWGFPRVLLRTYLLSLVAQGLLVLSVWILAQSLLDPVEWYWFPVIVPFVTLLSLAPISIGAAGLREYLYVTLFGLVGMPAQSALALSLSLFGATLFWALVGFVIYCAGGLTRERGAAHG